MSESGSTDLVQSQIRDLATRPADTARVDTTMAWGGSWVASRLGLSLCTTHSAFGLKLTDLVGLALRRNPRRAHLLVSTVLGKHVPADPRLVFGCGALLGLLVETSLTGEDPGHPAHVNTRFEASLPGALAGDECAVTELMADLTQVGRATSSTPPGTVVLGFAETATALGHAVADVLRAPYVHSTRRRVAGVLPVGTFEEEHSHATTHLLLPADPDFFRTDGPLVLVDDELSTGQTVLNTIAALHAAHPRARYVIAALVDLRSAQDRLRMAAVATDLGVDIDVVALAAGTIALPPGILSVGQALVAAGEAAERTIPDPLCDAPGVLWCQRPTIVPWPAGVREGARHGFMPSDTHALASATEAAASSLAGSFAGREILVLGHEELMYAPLCLALELVRLAPAVGRVRFCTTTRSPILAVDDLEYAVRTKLTFPSHDDPADGPGERFAYNVAEGADASGRFSDIVLVIDTPADTPALRRPDGLLSVLRGACDRLHLVVVPSHVPSCPQSPAPTRDRSRDPR